MIDIGQILAWVAIASGLLNFFLAGYIALQWKQMVEDERYILHQDWELQYYRTLGLPPPARVIDHQENYHESG